MISNLPPIHAQILYALYQLDATEFEEFIGELWERRGWETHVTRPSRDGGIDVIATRDDPFSQKQLIQTKRFAPDHNVTKKLIEQYAPLKQVEENVDAVVIITTGDFTESARQRATELNIKLLNGVDLASFIAENTFIDIVENHSGLTITAKSKINDINLKGNKTETESASQGGSSLPPAESEIPRSVTGLQWIEQSCGRSSSSQVFQRNYSDSMFEEGRWYYQTPICPECGTTNVNKNGTKKRAPKGSCSAHPHPHGVVQIQRYVCNDPACDGRFGTSLPYVEDGYRYIDDLRELVKITYAVTGASLPMLQMICLLHFGVKPSDQTLHGWRTVPTGEIITNQLPSHIFSGFYTYDEQVLPLRDQQVYRLLIYDVYRRVPVAEQIVESPTKDEIRTFLTAVFEDICCNVITTDGRSGTRDIVMNDLNAIHHRCLFHLLSNFQESLERRLGKSRPSTKELIATAIIGSEFKQLFDSISYSTAIKRLNWVVERANFLPKYLYKYIKKVDESRKKFLGYLKNECIPHTIKSCERYFSHSQVSALNQQSFGIEGIRSFLEKQMLLRTAREGLIPHERGIKLLQEHFTEVEVAAITELYTDRKQQFLQSMELKNR